MDQKKNGWMVGWIKKKHMKKIMYRKIYGLLNGQKNNYEKIAGWLNGQENWKDGWMDIKNVWMDE